jgi:hypothetical protein
VFSLKQIRNPNLEIRSKFEVRIRNATWSCAFGFRICFGFRDSCFGFDEKTPLNFLQAGRTAGPEQRRGHCEDGMNINGGESDVKKKIKKLQGKIAARRTTHWHTFPMPYSACGFAFRESLRGR